MKIIKRDGNVVKFNSTKIVDAIMKAAIEVDEKIDMKTMMGVLSPILAIHETTDEAVSVEEIQDYVEVSLMEHGLYKTAKAYILYREKRTAAGRAGDCCGKHPC